MRARATTRCVPLLRGSLEGRRRKDDQGEDLAPRDVEPLRLRDEVDPPVLEEPAQLFASPRHVRKETMLQREGELDHFSGRVPLIHFAAGS